ncbi:lamin tail domain-containing protein [Chloroflexi bacterium TSY]|nr:lamin tail domain-containing protein [Chloroflexi bacterium TSY]
MNHPENVMLYYRVDETDYISTSMTLVAGETDRYGAFVTGQAQDAVVDYYIVAEGESAEITLFPRLAPSETQRYLVGYEAPVIYINEIMASNGTVLEDIDEPNEFPDWLELYNPGSQPVSLDGLYLTDVLSKPTKYAITTGLSIPARGYLVFFADNDPEQGPTHTNFALNADEGEAVGLFGAFGNVAIDTVTFGPQGRNFIYGRFPNGTGSWGAPLCASPGIENILCDQQSFLPVLSAIQPNSHFLER